MKKIAMLLCFAVLLSLCSCTGEIGNKLNELLGIDDKDYDSEKIIAAPDPGSDTVKELTGILEVLCFGDGIITFDSFKDVSLEYTDVVLNYLSSEYFSKYSSDKALLESFSEEYPELNLSSLVPLSDYESTVYRCFGGNKKAVVRSTAVYTYLDKIEAFILVGQNTAKPGTVKIMEASETENTYRVSARFTFEGDGDKIYDVLFRKRGDLEPYIMRITASTKTYSK